MSLFRSSDQNSWKISAKQFIFYKVHLSTSFTLEFATLLKPELLHKYLSKNLTKAHNINLKQHLFVAVSYFCTLSVHSVILSSIDEELL